MPSLTQSVQKGLCHEGALECCSLGLSFGLVVSDRERGEEREREITTSPQAGNLLSNHTHTHLYLDTREATRGPHAAPSRLQASGVPSSEHCLGHRTPTCGSSHCSLHPQDTNSAKAPIAAHMDGIARRLLEARPASH